MKRITRDQAIDTVVRGGVDVYMITLITSKTTLEEISTADGYFSLEEKEEPEEDPKKDPKTDPEVKTVKVKEEKPRRNAKKIDHGKILALYKAGWSVAEIADEIGCSMQTVYNYLNNK